MEVRAGIAIGYEVGCTHLHFNLLQLNSRYIKLLATVYGYSVSTEQDNLRQ